MREHCITILYHAIENTVRDGKVGYNTVAYTRVGVGDTWRRELEKDIKRTGYTWKQL